MAAPEQTLEALVRDELRGPVSELVRRLVPELVAGQLNGRSQSASKATNVVPATPDPPATKRCTI